ncbi:MAG TPA: DUF4232 domain-containing protein [Chloroflexota bacterium]|nr:DUF4232 domain-containing protein [Chloroflexota bacterium]
MNLNMAVRIVLMATIAVLTCVTGVRVWTNSAGAAASSPSRCANYQLFIRPASSQGATGHIYLQFRIGDLLGPCTLMGYPGAELLDRNFRSMTTHVSQAPFPEGGPGPKQVTLSHQHPAFFVMHWSHFPVGNQTCPTARNVMLWGPHLNLPVVTYATIDACGGNVTVSPVAAKKFW